MRHQHKRHPDLIGRECLDRYAAPPEYVGQPLKSRRERHIIGREVLDGRQYDLHATKGYRSTRA